MEVDLKTTDGLSVPAGCIPPGSKLEFDGTWLEVPWRLQAEQVIVKEIIALGLRPAPADTIAYLVEDEVSDEQTMVINDILLSSQSGLAAAKLPASRRLFALRQNGSLRRLVSLDQNVRVFSIATAAGESLRLLFTLDLPTCDRSWFVLYEPEQGITGQWLAPANPLQWIWRPDRQDILFFVPRAGGRGFEIYKTGSTLALDPVSRTFAPLVFVGWNIELGRPVNMLAWFDTTYIDTLKLTTGGLERVHSYFQPIRAPRLSPRGEWLVYLSGQKNPFTPAKRLGLLHLKTQNDITSIQVAANEGVGFPTWSTYLEQVALAVLSGPVSDGTMLRPSRLFLISPDRSADPILVAQARDDEQLGAPVFCSDGSLLYRIERENHYYLLHHAPGTPGQIVLEHSRLFRPVACP
jgi:hypothetical protein